MAEGSIRRRVRPEPVALSTFAEQVTAARSAFGQDVTYAVQMARAASLIIQKRRRVAQR